MRGVCLSGGSWCVERQNATTYHQEGGKRKNQLLETGAHFVDRPVVVDGRIITSSGPGTATEVAFQLLEQLTSVENATYIRQKKRCASPGPEWYDTPQVP
nr:DJ-1/PfpI family protein [Pseudomonas hormoni]